MKGKNSRLVIVLTLLALFGCERAEIPAAEQEASNKTGTHSPSRESNGPLALDDGRNVVNFQGHLNDSFSVIDGGVEDDFVPIAGIPAPYPVCGNGTVEPTEQCDDANDDNDDGCNVLCCFPMCGNGMKELYEQCDDGNNTDNDGCSKDCRYERCGNKKVDKLADDQSIREECDDGNKEAGDGCSPCCKFEVCGNSVVDPNEECDDGGTENGDGCSDCCKLET